MSNRAVAANAASFDAVLALASSREARFAARQLSSTVLVIVAIER